MNQPLWTRNFTLLLLSNLFLFLALEMLLPTLPIFASDRGASDAQVGLIVALFTYSAVVTRLFVGVASDKFGKGRLLILGVLICLLGTVSYLAAATVSVMLMLRILHGIGFGLSTTLYGTIASDIIPARRRGEGMGFFGTGNSIAISLGPFIGIWLMDDYSFNVLFITGGVILLLALLFTLLVKKDALESVPEPKAAQPKVGEVQVSAYEADERQADETKAAGQHKSLPFLTRFIEFTALFPSLLGLLVGLSFGGVISFITLFGVETGIQNIAYFFLVLAISEFLIRFVSGRIFDTKGRFWVLFPSGILCLIGTTLLYFTDSIGLLILAAVFYGAGLGALFPALQAWVIDRVAPHRRGVATATFYNSFDLGIGSGAVLLGIVVTWTNYATMYLVSGVFFVIYLIVYYWYEQRQAKQSPSKKLAN
ncbi:MFS transporter [Paenibacillaceae bacterium]|nr:MFS transporter [Paenibacillaceae bacterium]